MSVINQMLKDLEQRSPEPNNANLQLNQISGAYSTRKVALISSVSVLILCLLSIYIWQLISENNALKAQETTRQLTNQHVTKVVSETKNVGISAEDNYPSLQPLYSEKNQIQQTSKKQTERIEAKTSPKAKPIEPPSLVSPSSAGTVAIKKASVKSPKLIEKNNTSRVTPAKKETLITDKHSHSGAESTHTHDVASVVKTKTNKMSVSRRQLSADELAAQKLVLAEKALAAKQITKAEKLLEDVVIIKPSDSQTRKKLAALWFGRQAYQDAINLLSQGIALNGKDSSLREMQARIFLQQGRVSSALNTLKPLAQLKDEQYQIMLANTAQQAQQNKVAIDAYQMLIAMQPEVGRWHMGLAVLYDKRSEFDLAAESYKEALTKNDLSLASENFVKQRIQVIGQ